MTAEPKKGPNNADPAALPLFLRNRGTFFGN